ncbi:MAG: DUF5906 domain-containing protein [Bradyrhizobium sp.]|uniref:DUF5906 domain-containing protein n=1 Tax=Bradyrhizobium sp. TaxID=376 RepID=UPI003D0C5744
MIHRNYDDAVAQLRMAGLILDRDLTFDAKIQRWKVEGEDRERRGWSRLKEWTSRAGNSYIVGVYGVWHGADDGYTRIEISEDGPGRELTKEDQASIREAQKEAARRLKKERDQEAKTASRWAALVWSGSDPCTEHEYLARKGIQSHGLRVLNTIERIPLTDMDDSNAWRLTQALGALVVPMHDPHGNVNGIQFIYPRGHARAKKFQRDKEFWPSGMAMGGTFGLIGGVHRAGILLVCEGYATAASLHEATGQSVAYAFSANNLAKAGKLLRKLHPRVRLLFCADDDYLTDGNPGVTHASRAQAEIELTAWIKPDFSDGNGGDLRGGNKLTDFNDLAQLSGTTLRLVDQINAKLDELNWRDAPLSRAGASSGGAGDDGRKRAKSVMPLDDLVERFVPLDDGTGKHVFDKWTNRVAHKDQMIALLPPGMRLDNIKMHPLWVDRGAYYLDEVGFDPTQRDPGVRLNTWRGWPLTPKQGNCERLLELGEYLCGGEGRGHDIWQWVLRWIAYPLQNPGAKMASAIIMHGPQGSGKSTLWRAVSKIYGDYATVLDQRGIEDKFNSDWADSKLFIQAEEVVTRAEMWHIKNELKELVTGEWIRVNPKNIAAYRQRNQVNIVYLSNENQPLPIDNDDRRHCVIWTPGELSEAFYDEINIELEQGGIAAFYDYLLKLDLTGFHPKKRPPMTEAKRELIALSQPSDTRFIQEWAAGDLTWPLVPCLTTDLYAAYLRWCRRNGESRPRPSNQFIGSVARLPGWTKKKTRIYPDVSCTGATIAKYLVMPPDELLQSAGTAKPPAEDSTVWITDCVFKFAQASEKDAEKWAA